MLTQYDPAADSYMDGCNTESNKVYPVWLLNPTPQPHYPPKNNKKKRKFVWMRLDNPETILLYAIL